MQPSDVGSLPSFVFGETAMETGKSPPLFTGAPIILGFKGD